MTRRVRLDYGELSDGISGPLVCVDKDHRSLWTISMNVNKPGMQIYDDIRCQTFSHDKLGKALR